MKPYTWEEIERVIRKSLENKGTITTLGTIGSRNIENDIDTLIFKEKKSKTI